MLYMVKDDRWWVLVEISLCFSDLIVVLILGSNLTYLTKYSIKIIGLLWLVAVDTYSHYSVKTTKDNLFSCFSCMETILPDSKGGCLGQGWV